MCSSREPASDPEAAWEEPSDADRGDAVEQPTWRCRRTLRAVVALLCAIALVVAVALYVRPRPEQRLKSARLLLDKLWLPEKEVVRRERAGEAELLLRRYLQEGGEEQSSANLLLGASLIAQGRDQSREENARILDLFKQVHPLDCSIDDLLIAVGILLTSDRPAAADELISAALRKSEEGDDRQLVLRGAINVRFYVGRDEDVLTHCRELARLDPSDTYPLRVMGAVYENQAKWDQLIDADRKLIALDPPDLDQIRHRLVESLITTGRADEARKQFELLRANAPELLQSSPLTEARLLHVEGQIDDALVILERVLAVTPDDPKALLLKGRIELARSKPDEAIQALTRLTEIDPTDNEAHYLLGQAYARSGDDQKAKYHLAMHRRVLDLKVKLYELERQANRNPADVELRLQIADLYGQLGWNDRVQYWREAAQSARAMRGY